MASGRGFAEAGMISSFEFNPYRQVSGGRCRIVYIPIVLIILCPLEVMCELPSLALVDSSTVFDVPSMASQAPRS